MVVADRKLVDLVIGAEADPEDAEGDTRLMTILQRMLGHARNSCLRMMAEMGMTATSRARVLDIVSDEEEDPAAKYFSA